MLLLQSCQCGLEAVEECVPHCAPLDDGGSGGSPATDGGSSRDAGAGFDGGTDAGWGDGCLDVLLAFVQSNRGDYVRLQGRVDEYRDLDFMVGGVSAGAWAADGIQRYTTAYVKQGVPPFLGEYATLEMSTGGAAVVLGVEYAGVNDGQRHGGSPSVAVYLSPLRGCPLGAGSGRFRFTRFPFPTLSSHENPVEGVYEFHCADAGTYVQGCFHYD
jgi:hypothetical protein